MPQPWRSGTDEREANDYIYPGWLWTVTPEQTSRSDQLLRLLVVLLGVVLVLPLLLMGLMMPMMGWMWMDGQMHMSPFWGIGLAILLPLILAGVGYALYRALAGDASSTDAALEELRLTYARGELSREEFEQRREDLRETREER